MDKLQFLVLIIVYNQPNCYQYKEHRAEHKLGLTRTMVSNTRQLSRSFVGIYHEPEIKYERFGGRPSVGGRSGPGPPAPLNPALGATDRCHTQADVIRGTPVHPPSPSAACPATVPCLHGRRL